MTTNTRRVTAGDALHTRTFEWLCDKCSKPIADDQGNLWVSYGDLRQVQAARTVWEADEYPSLEDMPKDAHWHVLHTKCDPKERPDSYEIGVERCRSAADLIAWAKHLGAKNWYGATNFDRLIRDAIDGWMP